MNLQDNLDLTKSEAELKSLKQDIKRKYSRLGLYDTVSINNELQQLRKHRDMIKEKVRPAVELN